MGLNGAGKSTLAHALAKTCGFFEMDVEDYYFPEQREARRLALENCSVDGFDDGNIPFTDSKTKDEVEKAILRDMKLHPKFVLAGVTMNWCDEILAKIDMAFVIQTSREERLNRIHQREAKRFGPRVLEGGDMFEQQAQFRAMAASRNFRMVEESAQKIGCPVVLLDGMLPIEENIRSVMEKII